MRTQLYIIRLVKGSLWALSAAALVLLSCTAQPGTVDQVQTNLVDKRIFEGEWWYSSTAIDVHYDSAAIFNSANAFAPFEGSMSTDYGLDFNRTGPTALGSPTYSFPIARVRWVIDENYLFAYRSYELVAGGNLAAGSPDYRGEPLAVFKILAHADIRNDYSPLTGEQLNVRVENTTDRKWYERAFMRVDWSQNLITDYAANDVQANELFTSFRRAPVSFFIQDGAKGYPASYKPQFVRVQDEHDYRFASEWPKEQQDQIHYMSFVTKESWSPVDSCLKTGGTCASAAVTMRNAFLRIPPKHDYAVASMSNPEFDHFGIFRSHQVTYAGGGQDIATSHVFCTEDSQCTDGGACDTTRNICVGGLTQDRGETDLLSFYMSRQNLFANSLDQSRSCVADWECDSRHLTCDDVSDAQKHAKCETDLKAKEGSLCDPAAHKCTIPIAKRTPRTVEYRLSAHYPPYLVRRLFEAVGQWNEALMRGERAARGILPVDQADCSPAQEDKNEDPSQVKGDGLCTANLSADAGIACQKDNPAAFCYCGSPEDQGGSCFRSHLPFEKPADAKARGVPNPYDCYIEGPADPTHPADYTDYKPADAYAYHFVGKECLLTLKANSCDLDPKQPCEELGDLRYQFLTYVQHGAVGFGGVTQPLSDPTSGELIVSNASAAAESVESIGTTASQFFPVLRGETPEDQYFSGETLRGYYSRLGRATHPIALAASGTDGYSVNDRSRPPNPQIDVLKDLSGRMERMQPRLQQLQGQNGRTAIFSDRLKLLRGTDIGAQYDGAITADVAPDSSQSSATAAQGNLAVPASQSAASTPRSYLDKTPLDDVLQERTRQAVMSARNMDDFSDSLYNSQYWQYWADAFKGRSSAEASIRMQQLYFQSVMVHELGHALGLQHNFAGSLDRDNYHDAYFAIARELPLPFFGDYDTAANGGNGDGAVKGLEAQRWADDLRKVRQQRLARGAGNVMTASIMDYEGDLSNFSGIGRYDAAAAMFEYFGKVEAYAAADPTTYPGKLPAVAQSAATLQGLQYADSYRRELFQYYRGGEACGSDADCPNAAGRESTIFQPITQRCVSNPRAPNTTGNCGDGGCICSNYFEDFDAYTSAVAYRSSTSNPEYTSVKYRYCNDNRYNDLSWCTRFDAGESFQEVVDHYRLSWAQRYPQAYFRNYRAAGPSRGYSQGSVVDAVKIYQHLFFRYNFEGLPFRQSVGPLGFQDQLLASADVLNWLGELIAAPDVGSYAFDSAQGVYHQTSADPSQPGDFSLLPGQGYYLWSAYQTGQNGFSRLERAGTFLDKLLAIEALAKRDWGLSYTIDERYYINFYDLFSSECIDLFGGLILRNSKAYAPRVTFDKNQQPLVHYLSLYRDNATTSNEESFPDPAIDGTDTETLRDAAAIQALATFPIFYDTSFEQRLLVFRNGSGDGYKIPAAHVDGTPTCGYDDAGCKVPDFITYDSDRLHTTFVAVVIQPDPQRGIDEQQLGFQLLLRLRSKQDRVRELAAKQAPSADEQSELLQDRLDLQREETFINYLIELERTYGISTYLVTR